MNEPQVPDLGKQLLAGVFVDSVTGDIEMAFAPGVNPVMILLDALRVIEVKRAQEAQPASQIAVPRGPLPKLR